MTTVRPFEISISIEVLDDLQKRLRNTRWTDEAENSDWDYGTNLGYLKNLVQYWSNNYNWKNQEGTLNKLNHYKADIDGFSLHFIYEKSKKKNATPIALLHGWPGSFLLMLKLLPLLIDSFDVIIPSLPGFGFSDQSNKKGMNMYEMGQLIHKLVTKHLGYKRYAIRCTDTGHGVAREIALTFPESLLGLHTEGSGPATIQVENMTNTEENFIKESQQFMQKEGSYFMIQSTKPQSLAYGLSDSPVGLAAWIVEKYRAWSDCKGDVETRFSKDDLLTTITLYWATQTINSSIRHYYELTHTPSPNANDTAARVKTPTAIFTGSGGPGVAPREWEERFFNVQRYTQYDKGGHFRDWEEPEAVSKDIKTFFTN